MARGVLTGTVVDGNGQVITEATVTIYDADTTDAATIYDAKSGGNIITDGIITANSNGYWIAYVDPADYSKEDFFDIVSSKADYSTRTQADAWPAGMPDLAGSATWNASEIAIGDMEAKDVTVTNAAVGDFAMASLSIDLLDLVLDAQVTAAGTVTCVLANNTAGAVDLDSATVYVKVIKNPAL